MASVSPSPVPTYTRSGSAGSMAMAPQQRLAAAKAVGFVSKPSIVDCQLRPLSSERHTPPLAVATYLRAPPGAMAMPDTRPLIAGRLNVWPREITRGPIGVQLLAAGATGILVAMALRAGRGPAIAALRRWYSRSTASQ